MKQNVFELQGNIFDLLADEIFSIVNGSGRKVTLWDGDNNLVYNPKEARRLFAEPDKLMIRILESGHQSTVKLYLGNTTSLEKLMMLIEQLRSSATRYGLLFEVRRYGKEIDPKIFSHLTSEVEESIENQSSLVNIFEIMNIVRKDLNWSILVNDSVLLEEIKSFVETNFNLIKESPANAGNKFIEEKETKMTKTTVTEKTHKLKIGPNTTLFVYEQIIKQNRVLSKIVVEH